MFCHLQPVPKIPKALCQKLATSELSRLETWVVLVCETFSGVFVSAVYRLIFFVFLQYFPEVFFSFFSQWFLKWPHGERFCRDGLSRLPQQILLFWLTGRTHDFIAFFKHSWLCKFVGFLKAVSHVDSTVDEALKLLHFHLRERDIKGWSFARQKAFTQTTRGLKSSTDAEERRPEATTGGECYGEAPVQINGC